MSIRIRNKTIAGTPDVSNKQDKIDNSLTTTNKTIVGAINELNAKPSVPEIDETTITLNDNDKLQASGTININANDSNAKFDWIGTSAEYVAQNIEELHPDWLCFITDDTVSVEYQEKLVSGTNIKTLNGDSILGSGNLDIDGLPNQEGQSGKFLTTDGTTPSWEEVKQSDKATYIRDDNKIEKHTTLTVESSNPNLIITNTYDTPLEEEGEITEILTYSSGWGSDDYTGYGVDIVYGNGVYVCRTSNKIYWSEDLKNWTEITYPSSRATYNNIQKIGFVDKDTNGNVVNQFYSVNAVATSSSNVGPQGYYSTDGKTWSIKSTSTTYTGYMPAVGSASSAGDCVVVLVRTSTSSSTYSACKCGSSSPSAIAIYDDWSTKSTIEFRCANKEYFSFVPNETSFRTSVNYSYSGNQKISVNTSLVPTTGFTKWQQIFYYKTKWYLISNNGYMISMDSSNNLKQETYPLPFTGTIYMQRIGDTLMFTCGKQYALTKDMTNFQTGTHDYNLECSTSYAGTADNGINGKFVFIDNSNKKVSVYDEGYWQTSDLERVELSEYSIEIEGTPQNNDTLMLKFVTKADYKYMKVWTGTKAEFDLIQVKDNNTLYNVKDDTTITSSLLDLMYPVGAIYIGVMDVCPLATLGIGTWILEANDRVLQGAGTRGVVGTTIEESLPEPSHTHTRGDMNITGTVGYTESWGSDASGAFYAISYAGRGYGTDSRPLIGFDASRAWTGSTSQPDNLPSTYQDGAPVQQNAYLVNIFRRIA